MVDKRESYTKEDLEASGRGELFGAGGPPLPAGNMLMMDRVVKMTEGGGAADGPLFPWRDGREKAQCARSAGQLLW